MRRLLVIVNVVSSSQILVTLKMKPLHSSETFVPTRVIRRSIKENGILQICTIIYGLCWRSLSRSRVPQNSWQLIIFSYQTPDTWSARSPYYHPQGAGWAYYYGHDWDGCILNRLQTECTHGKAISQKRALFNFSTLKTSNPTLLPSVGG